MSKSFFVLLLVVLFGCSKKEVQVPADVIGHDQMVRLLIDVHILEAKVKKLYLGADTSAVVFRHYENLLFDEQGISREKYQRSIDFYMEEIDLYRNIYNEVNDSLLSRSKTYNID